MDKKNILEYYFGSKPKYALVVTMAISKKQRKKHQQQKKKQNKTGLKATCHVWIIFMITNLLQQPIYWV